jgi:hypothetical protein
MQGDSLKQLRFFRENPRSNHLRKHSYSNTVEVKEEFPTAFDCIKRHMMENKLGIPHRFPPDFSKSDSKLPKPTSPLRIKYRNTISRPVTEEYLRLMQTSVTRSYIEKLKKTKFYEKYLAHSERSCDHLGLMTDIEYAAAAEIIENLTKQKHKTFFRANSTSPVPSRVTKIITTPHNLNLLKPQGGRPKLSSSGPLDTLKSVLTKFCAIVKIQKAWRMYKQRVANRSECISRYACRDLRKGRNKIMSYTKQDILFNSMNAQDYVYCKYLIKQTPSLIHAKDKLGNSLLYVAVMKGNLAMVKFLVRSGAEMNCRSEGNNTELHAAFKMGRLQVIHYLIKHGSDLYLVNNMLRTPVEMSSNELLSKLGYKRIGRKQRFQQDDILLKLEEALNKDLCRK